MEVDYLGFTLNVVNVMEPGLAIDVPDPVLCLRNREGKVSAVHYMDRFSRLYTLEPHIVTPSLSVVELPCFDGQNVWVFKCRSTETFVRKHSGPRTIPKTSRHMSSGFQSLQSIPKPPRHPTPSQLDEGDIWEP